MKNNSSRMSGGGFQCSGTSGKEKSKTNGMQAQKDLFETKIAIRMHSRGLEGESERLSGDIVKEFDFRDVLSVC